LKELKMEITGNIFVSVECVKNDMLLIS